MIGIGHGGRARGKEKESVWNKEKDRVELKIRLPFDAGYLKNRKSYRCESKEESKAKVTAFQQLA